MDKCDESVTSQTTTSGMQASFPLWARAASTLWPAHGVLTFSYAAMHAINKALFMNHDVIISFAQHYSVLKLM